MTPGLDVPCRFWSLTRGMLTSSPFWGTVGGTLALKFISIHLSSRQEVKLLS